MLSGLSESTRLLHRWRVRYRRLPTTRPTPRDLHRIDDPSASLEDLIQGEALLSDTYSRFRRVMGDLHPDTPIIHRHLETARVKVAHARLLATGETTTTFETVPGLDLEHVVIHNFPGCPAECVLVFWSCAAVALAWLVFFYKY